MYLRDKVSQKHSKEQFEIAQKIEQEYSKFFTGLDIHLASLSLSLFVEFVLGMIQLSSNEQSLMMVSLAGIVQGGMLPYICTQIVTIVDQEQSKVLWTPLGSP